MSKIHIGKKGSRYGVWVAAAGEDASAEGDRMILDSDRDAVALHDRQQKSQSGASDDEGAYLYNPFTFNFTALPYRPVVHVFWRWGGGDDKRFYYPFSTTVRKEDNAGHNVNERMYVEVFNNKVVVTPFEIYGSSLLVTVYIYRNKFTDA